MYDTKTRKVIEINPDLFTLKKSVKNKKPKKLIKYWLFNLEKVFFKITNCFSLKSFLIYLPSF